MAPGVEPLARFSRAQLIRQLRLGLLERHQQVLLQRFPVREVLLERFRARRRDAALPLLRRGAALLHAGLAPQLLRQPLRVSHLVVDVALQPLHGSTAATGIRSLLPGRSLLSLRARLRLTTRRTGRTLCTRATLCTRGNLCTRGTLCTRSTLCTRCTLRTRRTLCTWCTLCTLCTLFFELFHRSL